MFAPSFSPNSHERLSEPEISSMTTSVGDIDGGIDKLELVRNTLQNGVTPTLVAGIAMVKDQKKGQGNHSDLDLTMSSGNGSLVRTARFKHGIWHEYDLTHSKHDPRSNMTYGDSTIPPMDF